MDAPTLVSHCASILRWVIFSPRESIVFLFHFFVALVRFPLLWANVCIRTLIFGYIVFWPQIAIGKQWTQMCKDGRGIDGQSFSTGHESALLDILLPPELWDCVKNGKPVTKKYPVVVLYSGGAWIIGRRQWMRPVLIHFADAGFIAVAADYRQFPFGSMKDMIADALDSISYVFDQLEKPGTHFEHADPDQVVVLGQSAGAHISAIALLELAKVRKEQMLLVAQGVTGCDKPYLHSKMKGVPLALVGVGGFFDLVSSARDLHKKGLHSKVLEMMCEKEPLHNYCARSRAKFVAEEARKRFVESRIQQQPEEQQQSSSNAKSSVGQEEEEKQRQQGNKSSNKIKKNKSSSSSPSSSRSASGEICDKNSPFSNQTNSNINDNTKIGNKNETNEELEEALRKLESYSSVNFLPRFNLFIHGDEDNSAPLDQALAMCAIYNDAAARHPHELVGEDHRFSKTEPFFGTREPFYILTAKPNPKGSFDSAVKEVVTKKMKNNNNNNNGFTVVATASSSDDGMTPTATPSTCFPSSAMGDKSPQKNICDCYAGSRSIFMSYTNGTHTTIIVDDFFTEKTNPPLVVAVKAMIATLNDIEQNHAVVIPFVLSSNNINASLVSSAAAKHARTWSEAESASTVAVSPMVAQCSHVAFVNNNNGHNKRKPGCAAMSTDHRHFYSTPMISGAGGGGGGNLPSSSTQSHSGRTSNNTSPCRNNTGVDRDDLDHNDNYHHSREVSGSFLPDASERQEHPYDYLSAPVSIAMPSDLFTSLFQKYYHQIDRVEFRNPERPTISAFRRWLAQKISAF